MGARLSGLFNARTTDGQKGHSAAESSFLAYDHAIISSTCYPLSGKSKDQPTHIEPNARQVQLTTRDGFKLECVWVDYSCDLNEEAQASSSSAKVLVHFHGNGELAWQIAMMWAEDFHQSLNVHGCFFAEYRGYGESTGQASLCSMQQDLELVLAAVEEATGDWNQARPELIVYGRSIGTISALAFAARFPQAVAGLVLESGLANITDWVAWYVGLTFQRKDATSTELLALLNVDEATAAKSAEIHLDACRRLKEYEGPLLVLHTENDIIVGPEHARAFSRFAEQVPHRRVNKLVIWDRGDHNDIHHKNLTEYLEELREFSAQLGPPCRISL